MTPDLLAALRETPGCGEDPECITRHTLAVHHADDCNPCLTRLAEAVIEQVVARLPAGDAGSKMVRLPGFWRDYEGMVVDPVQLRNALLSALRSELTK